MRLSRRKFLGGAAAAAVGAASVYELVDKYSGGTIVRDGRHAWLRLVPEKITSWDFRKIGS